MLVVLVTTIASPLSAEIFFSLVAPNWKDKLPVFLILSVNSMCRSARAFSKSIYSNYLSRDSSQEIGEQFLAIKGEAAAPLLWS